MSSRGRVHEPTLTPAGVLCQQVAAARRGDAPYVLFLGAGASVTSGVPAVDSMQIEWQRQVFAILRREVAPTNPGFPETDFTVWRQDEYPGWIDKVADELGTTSTYSALFQWMSKSRQQRQIVIEQLVDDSRPSLGYIYLAGLIAAGYIDTVITTNFDDLIADALVRYYNIKPIVCAFDSAISSFSSTTRRPKIIKLHGDFLFDSIQTLESETLDLSANMEAKLVDMCVDKGLIVVGYAGNDESVMNPIRENLRRNPQFCTKGIHWCAMSNDGDQSRLRPNAVTNSVLNLGERFPNQVFFYAADGFDELMLNMFEVCDLPLPKGVLRPYSVSPAHDFGDACARYLIYKPALSASMSKHRRAAVGSLDNEPDRRALVIDRAGELFAEARSLEFSDPPAARKKFEESLALTTEVIEASTPADSEWWPAIRRETGVKVGIAKLSEGTERAALLAESLKPVLSYLRDDNQKVSDLLRPDFVLAIYNAACASGLLWADSTSDTDRTRYADIARQLVSAMCRSSVGRVHRRKLKSDTDIVELLEAGELDGFFELDE